MWRRRQHVGRTLWHNGPSHFSFSHIFSFSVSPSLPPSFLEGADRFRGKWPREPETQGFSYAIEKNCLPCFLFLFLLFHPIPSCMSRRGLSDLSFFLFSRNQRFPSLSSSFFRFLLFSPSLPLPSSSVARVSKIPGFSSDLFPLFCQSAQPAIARKQRERRSAVAMSSSMPPPPPPFSPLCPFQFPFFSPSSR